MHPELITLPGGFSIKMYGFFLMVGFLSAVWLGMRRAARVNVDPDRVLDISFVALIAGVGGARLFYVIHYWQTQFADQSNKLLAVVDIRQGGLEFLGGFLGAIGAAVIYMLIKKQSIRLYLDVLAPSAMWGVAFGRLGCFFNGCCFGGVCAIPETGAAQYPWAVQFPYGSSAQIREWEDRQVTIPAELMTTGPDVLLPWPVSATLLDTPPDKRDRPLREFEELAQRYQHAREDAPEADQTKQLKAQVQAARDRLVTAQQELATVRFAQQYPSRFAPKRRTLFSELSDLAREQKSKPVHPVQLYASLNAFLLSALLSMVFYRRKRHGVVIGLLWVLYPIARFFEEAVRVDNPHDVLGLTVSQAISVAMFALGVIYLIVIYAWLPQRSPRADAAAPPPVEAVPA